MSVNLDAFLGVHERAIQQRGLRTKLLASNIANVDTPGYKATDLAFGDTLAAVRGVGTNAARRIADGEGRTLRLAAPHAPARAGHLPLDAARGASVGGTAPGAGRVMYRYPDAPSLDGNTVDKDIEQARFAENAVRYQASLQFLQSRASSLIRALKGEQA